MAQPAHFLRLLRAHLPADALAERARVRRASRVVVGEVTPVAETSTVLLLEALNGQRQEPDLWRLHPSVIAALKPWLWSRPIAAPREVKILRVIVQEVEPGLADVAVIAQHGGLIRAVTWRFEAIMVRATAVTKMWWEATEVGF